MANMQDPSHVVTGLVRLSYVHIFQPYKKQNQSEAKYSVTVLLPKSDIATKQRIDAAIQAAILRGTQTCWQGQQVSPDLPVHDGDGVKPRNRTPYSPECKGHWVINTSSNRRPQIVDANGNPIINESEVYSGCYGRVSMDFYPFANNGMGIACGLGNVQKLQDGEVLGGGTTAEQDFGAMGDAGYAAQTAPAYPTIPSAYPAVPATPPMAQGAYPAAPNPYPAAAPAYPAAPVPYSAPQTTYPMAPAAYPAAAPTINPITGLPM